MTGDCWERLPRDFYLRDTVTVARDLLGRYLIRETPAGRLCCRITETEAYCGPGDPACHSHKKASAPGKGRTNVMYAAGGVAYVYLIYGMYCCFNVVTRPTGEPEAVLIRSAQPLLGLEEMTKNRRLPEVRKRALLTGPGKLCQALAIDRGFYGEPLWGERLWLAAGEPLPPEAVAARGRRRHPPHQRGLRRRRRRLALAVRGPGQPLPLGEVQGIKQGALKTNSSHDSIDSTRRRK